MNTDYKTFSCYTKMEESLRKSFDSIVETYSPLISGNAVISLRPAISYDFEHHCINVFKAISDYIVDADIVFNNAIGFSQRELYILNLSVLFHSISIYKCQNDLKEFCNYPSKSADFVMDEYNDVKSFFRKKCDLIPEESKALIDIIRVHDNSSDLAELNYDLSEMRKLKSREGRTGHIRTKFLAGVLRLANKMDITSARLGNDDFESILIEKVEEEQKLKNDIGSSDYIMDFSKAKEDFERLHFISHIRREDNLKTIVLCTDDDYVKSSIDDYNIEGTGEKIFAIYDILSHELYNLKKDIFNTSGRDAHFIPIETIKIETGITKLQDYLDDKISTYNFDLINKSGAAKQSKENSKKSEQDTNLDENTEDTIDTLAISAISEEIEKNLSEEIIKRNLLKFGHFKLDEKYCARDWIDTRELVETEKISSKMVLHILNHIKDNAVDCDMIVGVDLVGSLLAARLAFYLIKPLTYIIPKKVQKYSPPQDKFYDLKQFQKIIIIIDSIVTGETIQQIIDENNLHDRIKAIYAMFYRKCTNIEVDCNLQQEYLGKVHCLNAKQPVELFLKSNCKYQEIKCMDRNSRVF